MSNKSQTMAKADASGSASVPVNVVPPDDDAVDGGEEDLRRESFHPGVGQDVIPSQDDSVLMRPPLAESTVILEAPEEEVDGGDEDFEGIEEVMDNLDDDEDDQDEEMEDDSTIVEYPDEENGEEDEDVEDENEDEDEDDDEDEEEDDEDEDEEEEEEEEGKVEEVTIISDDELDDGTRDADDVAMVTDDDPLSAGLPGREGDYPKSGSLKSKLAALPITLSIRRVKRDQPEAPSVNEKQRRKTSASQVVAPAMVTRRRPGRPSKAEMQRREKERLDRIARGEPDPPPPKRRGRKPVPAEEKAKLSEEKRKQKLADRTDKPDGRRRRRRQKKSDDGKSGNDKPVVRKRGRKAKVLSEEEKAAREEMRKKKYEELRKIKAEKAAKRAERNLLLRELRKKKKEEEKRQREAYDRKMQELKASFLDENSHLSTGNDDGFLLDETTQSSLNGSKARNPLGNFEMNQLGKVRQVTAETLFEYRWPLEGKHSEHYFLQEQVCEYLGLKSFKRRYPDLQRRNVEVEERDFLVEMGVVSETQADLGLTALPSSQVLDIMSNDFYEKYDAYMAVVVERKDKVMRQTNYTTATVEKHKYADFVEKSVRSAAAWNKKLNQEKKEKRKAYFDLQTFTLHHPVTGRGKMTIVQKPPLGNYPVALIPGQFVDFYKAYAPKQLSLLPLNSTLKGPPKSGARLADYVGESDGVDSDSDSDSGSSLSSEASSSSASGGSETGSSSSDEDDREKDGKPVEKKDKETEQKKPKRPIDAEIPGATCKTCLGDRYRNKLGMPEKLLHCSKCELSMHPTCIGLSLELLEYVTNYNWECTECKVCSKCHDHSDEDKMLFCDLCDRGYHNYCVGLDTIPIGRWHCFECTYCVSCKVKDTAEKTEGEKTKWVLEFKPGPNGSKVYSHTMCGPCHRAWKRGQFCPECMVVFGREPDVKSEAEVEYANCWVCSRQHHLACVGQATFICYACQKRTMEKMVGAAQRSASSRVNGSGDLAETSSVSNSAVTQPAPGSEVRSSPTTRLRPSMESGPVTCEVCQKVYKNRSTLYSHKNRDHGIKASTQIRC